MTQDTIGVLIMGAITIASMMLYLITDSKKSQLATKLREAEQHFVDLYEQHNIILNRYADLERQVMRMRGANIPREVRMPVEAPFNDYSSEIITTVSSFEGDRWIYPGEVPHSGGGTPTRQVTREDLENIVNQIKELDVKKIVRESAKPTSFFD